MSAKSSLWRLPFVFYAAFISIIFALMVISYPLGAYVVFNTELGSTITHEFPLKDFFFFAVLPVNVPIDLQLGEFFVVMWCFYLLFFALLMFGPKRHILQSLLSMIQNREGPRDNSLGLVIVWFAVFFVVSKAIDLVQQSFGVSTGSIEFDNQLIQFFNLTAAPVREEIGFRVFLIGIPAYFILAGRLSISGFFKTLWNPSKHLPFDERSKRNIYALIIISAVIFGVAHLLFGGGWTFGKVSQAIVGGLILGWVYYRYGLHAAMILHWSVNYFIFSYAFFGSTVWGFSWNDPALNPLLAGIDFLLTIAGIIAILIFLQKFIRERISVSEQNSFKDTGVI